LQESNLKQISNFDLIRSNIQTYILYQAWINFITNSMKKLNKKYADLLHQASIATGRKEAVGLLHKAAKLQTKFDEKSNL